MKNQMCLSFSMSLLLSCWETVFLSLVLKIRWVGNEKTLITYMGFLAVESTNLLFLGRFRCTFCRFATRSTIFSTITLLISGFIISFSYISYILFLLNSWIKSAVTDSQLSSWTSLICNAAAVLSNYEFVPKLESSNGALNLSGIAALVPRRSNWSNRDSNSTTYFWNVLTSLISFREHWSENRNSTTGTSRCISFLQSIDHFYRLWYLWTENSGCSTSESHN